MQPQEGLDRSTKLREMHWRLANHRTRKLGDEIGVRSDVDPFEMDCRTPRWLTAGRVFLA